MADVADKWIALFPLNTLLFPDGVLPLRVFETRYVDMVRECMKANVPFGVVGIKAGQEVGAVAEPYAVGTIANITQWDMPEFGVLLIQTRGGERFNILETRLLPSKRLEARIEIIEPDVTVSAEADELLNVCAKVLGIVIQDLETRARNEHAENFISPFSEPHKMNDTAWVANRWCEMLPIPLAEKQRLLEMTDAAVRLENIEFYLRKNGVI
jgi:Lon protease-like protein